jgi:hypothetical protein
VFLAFSGGFAICNTEPPANATFTIGFHNDSGGLPVLAPFATRTVDPNQMDTGVNLIDDIFEFTAAISPAVPVTNGNTVWMSIQLNPNQTCEFLWIDASADALAARSTNGAAFAAFADDLAFRLNIAATEPGPPPPPANNDCANASVITNGSTLFSTLGATTDGPDNGAGNPCNDFGETQTHNDIWFTYQATCTGTLCVSTCEDTGGSAAYDTDLVVYNVTTCPASTANRIACNDDDSANPCGVNNFHSTIQVGVTSGNTYLIRVGGWSAADSGTGSLFISCGAGCP